MWLGVEPTSCRPLQPAKDGRDERRVALQVSFTLPAAAYATMAIRELTKLSDDALREFPT